MLAICSFFFWDSTVFLKHVPFDQPFFDEMSRILDQKQRISRIFMKFDGHPKNNALFIAMTTIRLFELTFVK